MDNNINAFYALVRAGLWERDIHLLPFGKIEFSEVCKLADEQSVTGLVAAGVNRVQDTKINVDDLAPIIGAILQTEELNRSMNLFIGDIIEKMRGAGINTLLVKGQGVAQCYERPLWRSCGDVDFLLDSDNYSRAKAFLAPMASSLEEEDSFRLHLGMIIDPWMVELHGTSFTEISKRINDCLTEVQEDIFKRGGVRFWDNDSVRVLLPNPDNDIILIFTHFIQHFYVGGVGLRQICDWCRLLWTYQKTIDVSLLERRINTMGLMSEWKAFASFAVEYLGMPVEVMPFYPDSAQYARRAHRISSLILETGNFGHNKDESYRSRYPRVVGKTITFFRRIVEFLRIATIFPKNAPVFFMTYVNRRLNASL